MRHFTFLIGDLWPNCPLPDDLARALLTADEALALVSKTEVSIPDGVEIPGYSYVPELAETIAMGEMMARGWGPSEHVLLETRDGVLCWWLGFDDWQPVSELNSKEK
jgi:hypothetical protein